MQIVYIHTQNITLLFHNNITSAIFQLQLLCTKMLLIKGVSLKNIFLPDAINICFTQCTALVIKVCDTDQTPNQKITGFFCINYFENSMCDLLIRIDPVNAASITYNLKYIDQVTHHSFCDHSFNFCLLIPISKVIRTISNLTYPTKNTQAETAKYKVLKYISNISYKEPHKRLQKSAVEATIQPNNVVQFQLQQLKLHVMHR